MTNTNEKDCYRTIPKAVKYFHEIDPESAVTEYGIRKAIEERRIQFSRVGRRYYLTVRAIENLYEGEKI